MKIFFSLLLCLFYQCIVAQTGAVHDTSSEILVGQCMTGTEILARLAYEVSDSDTVYTFLLRNRQNGEPEAFSSVRFSGGKKVVNQLYATIKLLIARRNKRHKDYTTTVALADKLVVMATTRVMGNTAVIIYLPRGSNSLTEWQVDKVFGRT